MNIRSYFTKAEKTLWSASILLITVSFCFFDRENYLTLVSSLIGVTSLIFSAKGNPLSQVLMIVFSVFYGFISLSYCYYGEMITYLGMTAPMAVFALISWLRHPYRGKHSEVEVNRVHGGEIVFMIFLAAAVTVAFYFILRAFDTANLIPSTFSVTTSFLAVYLTMRRSPFFAVCYAANDVVLIVLWMLATLTDISYLSVAVCFCTFLANDIYTFINWLKMQKRQNHSL